MSKSCVSIVFCVRVEAFFGFLLSEDFLFFSALPLAGFVGVATSDDELDELPGFPPDEEVFRVLLLVVGLPVSGFSFSFFSSSSDSEKESWTRNQDNGQCV